MSKKKNVIKHRSPMPPPSRTHKDKKYEQNKNECRRFKYTENE